MGKNDTPLEAAMRNAMKHIDAIAGMEDGDGVDDFHRQHALYRIERHAETKRGELNEAAYEAQQERNRQVQG